MNKLKIKKITNLLDYKHFLRNNDLKENGRRAKLFFYESIFLYNNLDSKTISLNSFQNAIIPHTVMDYMNIYSIKNSYKEEKLFDYNLNYNWLYIFNQIFLQIKQRNSQVKSRIVHSTNRNKEVLLSFLGICFAMKSIDLNNLIDKINKRRSSHKKGLKKNQFNKFFYKQKKKRIKQLIRSYTLRKLNFVINEKRNFSRILYIEKIVEQKHIKKQFFKRNR